MALTSALYVAKTDSLSKATMLRKCAPQGNGEWPLFAYQRKKPAKRYAMRVRMVG